MEIFYQPCKEMTRLELRSLHIFIFIEAIFPVFNQKPKLFMITEHISKDYGTKIYEPIKPSRYVIKRHQFRLRISCFSITRIVHIPIHTTQEFVEWHKTLDELLFIRAYQQRIRFTYICLLHRVSPTMSLPTKVFWCF